VLWLGALVLLQDGCARASSPPPPSAEPSARTASTPVATGLEPRDPVTPTTSSKPSEPPSAAPRVPAPTTSTPARAPAAAPSLLPTPGDCSTLKASADQRAFVTCNAKEEFRSFLSARQACTAASQCEILPGACPFGCFIPVAKASKAEVASKLNELGERLERAGNRCAYRCMSPPAAACVEQRCSKAAP
jgi:hypothetical protein